MTMTWKRKVDDRRADQPLRVRARITEVAGLAEDVCQITAAVRVEILQGLAREVALTIPAGLVVNQVNGATVADWDASGGLLLVKLLGADGDGGVVRGVRRRADAARRIDCCVPLLRVPSAERETGGVAVDVDRRRRDQRPADERLRPGADPSELGDLVAGRESPSMIAFRSRPLEGTDARSLTVGVVRYTPQAVFIANGKRRAIARWPRKTDVCWSKRATPSATISAAS